MLLNEIKPDPLLGDYVRLYRIIDFQFNNAFVVPPKLYTPRPEQCLQFYPKDKETVSYNGSDEIITDKNVVVSGINTILSRRCVGKNFLSIQVVFQPSAFYCLTGISMDELVNVYLDAGCIFGDKVGRVNEQLANAGSYREMITIVEGFLIKLIKNSIKAAHRIDVTSKMMLLEYEDFGLAKFIKESCLCHRQFDRKFNERIGISPKHFLRIVRFDKAFRLKNKYPKLDWMSIAIRCGYQDYQHLAKDYREFTGYTPTEFFALDSNAPERTFGDAEV